MDKSYIPLSSTPLLSSSKSKDVGCDIVLTEMSTGKCTFDNKVNRSSIMVFLRLLAEISKLHFLFCIQALESKHFYNCIGNLFYSLFLHV
jgi:hypothetical protein